MDWVTLATSATIIQSKNRHQLEEGGREGGSKRMKKIEVYISQVVQQRAFALTVTKQKPK